jgi:hypothetical protein
MACLSLRVNEAFGLQPQDVDWQQNTVTVHPSAYRGAVDETNTSFSKTKLALPSTLAEVLKPELEA